MNTKNDLTQSGPIGVQKGQRERKSRFQIVKLEERIAPAKGGIPGRPSRDACSWRCS